jgi:hypothetical protein
MAKTAKSKRRNWNWLLLLPVIALAFPGFYARATPTLLGFPFFYWYQIVWILLTGVLTAIVYFATDGL